MLSTASIISTEYEHTSTLYVLRYVRVLVFTLAECRPALDESDMKLVIPARRLLLAACGSHPRASSSLLRRVIPALLPRVPPLSATFTSATDRVQQASLLLSPVASCSPPDLQTESRTVQHLSRSA